MLSLLELRLKGGSAQSRGNEGIRLTGETREELCERATGSSSSSRCWSGPGCQPGRRRRRKHLGRSSASTWTNVNPNAGIEQQVSCNYGDVAIAGGYEVEYLPTPKNVLVTIPQSQFL